MRLLNSFVHQLDIVYLIYLEKARIFCTSVIFFNKIKQNKEMLNYINRTKFSLSQCPFDFRTNINRNFKCRKKNPL